MTTVYEVVRRVFPEATDKECEYLLWEKTGYPGFWATGNPEHDIEHSLREYKKALERGVPLCTFCNEDAIEHGLCKSCAEALS